MKLKILSLFIISLCQNVIANEEALSGEELDKFLDEEPELFETRELNEEQLNFYKHRTGLIISEESKSKMERLQRKKFMFNNTQNHMQQKINIPDEFDARTHWDNCPSIKEIFNQGRCGSCWAVAVAMMMSDRACIATNGRHKPRFSAMNLAQCCENCHGAKTKGDGCQGGDVGLAIEHIADHGVVTGGYYESNIGCQPYPLEPGIRPWNKKSGDCVKKCNNGKTEYKNDLHFGGPNELDQTMTYFSGEEHMKYEIYNHGPIVAGIEVHLSFLSYYIAPKLGKTKGIYYVRESSKLGPVSGHAMRVIGWGVDDVNGKKIRYWLVANSWGKGFGNEGIIKIVRGSRDRRRGARIEDHAWAGYYNERKSPRRNQY